MPPIGDLLRQYGVVILFVWAFLVQAGMPAPAVPVLVGAGALSAPGLVFDLKQRLDRDDNVTIVDLRTTLDIQASPLAIAGRGLEAWRQAGSPVEPIRADLP